MTGRTLARYEIRAPIGRGTVGTVYEAWDPVLARKAAVKIIQLDGTGDHKAEFRDRFRREARAAGGLSHPNIVGIFDYGETDDFVYIVMQHVDGVSLRDMLASGEPLPLPAVRRVMAGLLDGLGHSHEHGVIHRDIKPANVMLARNGQVRIADFGVAHLDDSTGTRTGTVIGTPAYMAPEQVLSDAVDRRADLYAAGVVLYQMLTGRRPFEGGMASVMNQIVHKVPPRPSEVSTAAIPPGLNATVLKALAKRPEDRVQSAAEFRDALRTEFGRAGTSAPQGPALDAEGTQVLGAPRHGDAAAHATASDPPKRSQPAEPPAPRRSRAPAWAAVGVVAAMLAGGAALWLTSQNHQRFSATASPAPPQAARPSTATTASDAGTPRTANAPATETTAARTADPYQAVAASLALVLPEDAASAAVQFYARAAGQKALAAHVDGEDKEAFTWPNAPAAADASQWALEGCELKYASPCVLVAAGDQLRAPDPRTAPRQTMERLRYAGPFRLDQVPMGLEFEDHVRDYDALPGAKSIAAAASGYYQVKFGALTQAEAERDALALCNEDQKPAPCFLYASGDQVVLPERRTQPSEVTPPAAVAAPVAPPTAPPAAPVAPAMVALPSAAFQMGSNEAPSERPVHAVAVPPFLIAQHATTVREWQPCLDAKACTLVPRGKPDDPVTNASWDDAEQYAAWLSKSTGERYRLPTEAEWEYAARGGTQTRYPWGNAMLPGKTDCKGCWGVVDPQEPPAAEAYPPNPFGLYGMGGGVAEWVADCWHRDYRNAPRDGSVTWDAQDCRQRVLRGGSWMDDAADVRASSREFYDAPVRYPTHGFRVARSAQP